MATDLILINKFPFLNGNPMLFLSFSQRVHYWDWEYKTANIVLFSIKHVADILYVSRLIR